MNFLNEIKYKIIALPFLIVSLIFHECAHGLVAYKLGDPTAKMSGRLTLNPLKHLDPIGTIAMLIAPIGWARPVPVNPRYFKNPKKGMACVALAGPLTNFILAFVGLFVYGIIYKVFYSSIVSSTLIQLFLMAAYYFAQVNITLMAFNFIPFPPLDGSKIVFAILPDRYYYKLMQYEQYGIILMMALVFFGAFDTYLGNALQSVTQALLNVVFNILF